MGRNFARPLLQLKLQGDCTKGAVHPVAVVQIQIAVADILPGPVPKLSGLEGVQVTGEIHRLTSSVRTAHNLLPQLLLRRIRPHQTS